MKNTQISASEYMTPSLKLNHVKPAQNASNKSAKKQSTSIKLPFATAVTIAHKVWMIRPKTIAGMRPTIPAIIIFHHGSGSRSEDKCRNRIVKGMVVRIVGIQKGHPTLELFGGGISFSIFGDDCISTFLMSSRF
jgi:hypothetical protein